MNARTVDPMLEEDDDRFDVENDFELLKRRTKT
jgi:hypothetical protein